MTSIIPTEQLRVSDMAHEFEGYLYDAGDVSFILVDAPPGSGPRLHRHPYAEIFIVQEGRARYTVGEETIEAAAGQVIVVPPGVAHAFANAGDGPLRQVDIHAGPRFITEWLEDDDPAR